MTKKFTKIVYEYRDALGISNNEYILLSSVYHLSKENGTCRESREVLASYVGMSVRGLSKMQGKLADMGLLEILAKSELRCSERFVFVVTESELSTKKDGEVYENKVPIPRNKVPSSQELSSEKEEQSTEKLELSSCLYIDYDNKNKSNDNRIDRAISKPSKKRKKAHLFKDSIIAEISEFKKAFDDTDYHYADLDFYYELVGNWSESKLAKRVDWIATARGFMLRDKRDGKLQLKNGISTKQNFDYAKSGTKGNGQGSFDHQAFSKRNNEILDKFFGDG